MSQEAAGNADSLPDAVPTMFGCYLAPALKGDCSYDDGDVRPDAQLHLGRALRNEITAGLKLRMDQPT